MKDFRSITAYYFFRLSCPVLSLKLLTLCPAAGDELSFTIDKQCMFGGRENRIEIVFDRELPDTAKVYGSVNVNSRMTSRVRAKRAKGKRERESFILKITLPSVDPSVIIPAELELVIHTDKTDNNRSGLSRKIYIFHADPFEGRGRWLEQLNLQLFDPKGDTRKQFTELNIPFKEINNKSRISMIRSGVLMLGAGLSLQDHPDLLPLAAIAAEKGAAVLSLGFVDGESEFTCISTIDRTSPRRISLAGAEVIKLFDKRFDVLKVPPGRTRISQSMRIVAGIERIAGVFDGEGCWEWYEAEFAGGGRLTVCTLPLFQLWDESPTARYLLLEILKHISAQSEPGPK